MDLVTHLGVDVVAIDSEDELTVMLELTAPIPEASRTRPQATLQVVLDRSGSMGGGRLEGAKRALFALVDRLEPTDNFGLVSFDQRARVEVPAGQLGDKDAVRAKIASLSPGGMTDLSSGFLRGTQEAKRASSDGGATLILISDGHANEGVTDHDQLRLAARSAHQHGVVTTTLGYGLGYDEQLLGAISDGGTGSALFAEEPDTAGKLIAGEVEGLLNKVAQAASLTIRVKSPVESVAVLGGLDASLLDDGSVMVELGDFYAGECRKLLLRFAIPGIPALGLATVAELSVSHVEIPVLTTHTVTLPISVNVVPGDEARGRVPNPVVESEAVFLDTQESKRLASEALRSGDIEGATGQLHAAACKLDRYLASGDAVNGVELKSELDEIRELAEAAALDDTSRSSKRLYSNYHESTRKNGRERPPTE